MKRIKINVRQWWKESANVTSTGGTRPKLELYLFVIKIITRWTDVLRKKRMIRNLRLKIQQYRDDGDGRN